MKSFLYKLLLLGAASPLFGQIDESKLNLPTKELPALRPEARNLIIAKGCCDCPGNILLDGGFEKLTVGNQGNITANPSSWSPASKTPQWNNGEGVCNKGFISMWGNQHPSAHESVKQKFNQPPGKYKGKFVARFRNQVANSTQVNLQISINNVVVNSAPITSTSWGCYDIPEFTAPAGSQGADLVLRASNQHNQNNGAFVSWIDVDSICLEKVPDCNCDALAKEIKIQGPTEFCKPVKCDSTLSFSAPKLDAKCFTYAWSVSPEVKFEGQGTPAIGIPCKSLKSGKYEFKLSITCNGKSVSTGHVLNVCDKPDPAFNFNSNGNSVTLSSSVAGNHSWYLVADANSNCSVDNNETPVAPGVQTGNSVSYAGLVSGQQYVVMHYVDSQCGKRCVSLKSMCFKFMPSQMKQAPGSAPVAEKSITVISDKEVESEIIESAMRGWPLPKVDTRPRPPIKK